MAKVVRIGGTWRGGVVRRGGAWRGGVVSSKERRGGCSFISPVNNDHQPRNRVLGRLCSELYVIA